MAGNQIYLGDGVYAKKTLFHIELTTGSHQNKTLVYLEPDMVDKLKEFKDRE